MTALESQIPSYEIFKGPFQVIKLPDFQISNCKTVKIE